MAGARTVEALRLQARRVARTQSDLLRAWRAERYTLGLRMVWFPLVELGYVIPVAATLGLGGLFALRGWASIGQMTAATLYVQQLIDPLDRLLSWMDELQVGGASLARLLGVALVPADRAESGRTPVGEHLVAGRSATPMRRAPTCCTGSTCACGQASGSRWWARAARGRPHLAGCWRASTRPASVR